MSTLTKGKFTAMIFIDLKKAFDTVDHGIPLDKMKFYGISGIEHDWFRSYLNNRKQFCKVNDISSDIKDIDRYWSATEVLFGTTSFSFFI